MPGPPGPPVPPAVLGAPAVLVDERKHPGSFHWRWWATLLGEDERGRWLAVPSGTVARRGVEEPRVLGTAFVVLVPRDDPWVVECYLDHDRVATYVNVGTVPTWHDGGTRVEQVDLDLDVERTVDGTVTLLDEDEFEERRVAHRYPDALVELARDGAARAFALLQGDPACFGQGPWLDRLAALLEEAP